MVPDDLIGKNASSLNVINLRGNISADGHMSVHGVVRIDDGATTSLLTPVQGSAQPTCAEADDDRVGGLTGFEVTLRDIRSGEQLPLTMETLHGTAIEASGAYRVTITIGEHQLEAAMHVQIRGR